MQVEKGKYPFADIVYGYAKQFPNVTPVTYVLLAKGIISEDELCQLIDYVREQRELDWEAEKRKPWYKRYF